jgi:uncharacterized membrane protein
MTLCTSVRSMVRRSSPNVLKAAHVTAPSVSLSEESAEYSFGVFDLVELVDFAAVFSAVLWLIPGRMIVLQFYGLVVVWACFAFVCS